MIPNGTISSTVHTLRLSRTGRANTGIERDVPDVAPLEKGGLTSHIRHENFDEGSNVGLTRSASFPTEVNNVLTRFGALATHKRYLPVTAATGV
jgi:hypothetical protein